MLNNKSYFLLVLVMLTECIFIHTSLAQVDTNNQLNNCRKSWSQFIPKNEHLFRLQNTIAQSDKKSETYEQYINRVQRSQCKKDWTVLVFMEAENNLTPYAFWDIHEMESVGSTLKTDIIVQVNTQGNQGIARYNIFQANNLAEKQPLSIDYFQKSTLKDIKSPVVQILSESDNQTEYQRLNDFLKWGVTQYPADHYWVIVWGHGQGWKSSEMQKHEMSDQNLVTMNESHLSNLNNLSSQSSFGFEEPFGGIAYNEQTHDILDIPQLAHSLNQISNRIHKKIDFYTSDACLMQMIEVTTEVSPAVRFIAGTNQIQSYQGLPYRRIFTELNSGRFNGEHEFVQSNDEPYLLARMLPKLIQQSYNPKNGSQSKYDSDYYHWLTSSTINTDEQNAHLIPALRDLSIVLKKYLNEDSMRALDLQLLIQKTPHYEGDSQDIGIFIGLLKAYIKDELHQSNFDLKSKPTMDLLLLEINQVENAINETLVSSALGNTVGLDSNTHVVDNIPKVLSFWLPTSTDAYLKRKNEFLNSSFYQQTQWNQWLELLYP